MQYQTVESRCNSGYIEQELKKRFNGEKISVESVEINKSGEYKAAGNSFNKIFGVSKEIRNLPVYCDVRVTWCTGEFKEKIIVWSPMKWNERFAGTAGGGTGIGGEGYLTAPDDYTRGWTVPYAVMRGFTAATADGRNINGLHDYMLEPDSGKIRPELYENWRVRTTHHMTLIGKAIAEIIHEKPVRYSYMSGGSGGGRQCMVEAQEYPEDYDGIWASCPAMNWNKFLLEGLWANAVMNSYQHVLKPEKIQYYMESVWKSAGGREQYFTTETKPVFDAYSIVGERTGKGIITSEDAKVMKALWDGPVDSEGNRLWYGFRPGVKFWNVGIPVGAFYYSLLRKKPTPFFLATMHGRWITEHPKQKFDKITLEEYVKMFYISEEKFADTNADKANLQLFANQGGKLMIDHGLNDPLIPVDGTIDYFKKMLLHMGERAVKDFCRLYLVPGDGHGNCWNEQPGIAQHTGIDALMDWVENKTAPDILDGVKVNRKTKEVLKKAAIKPVERIEDWE